MLVFASLSQLAPFILANKKSVWLFYNLYIVVDVSFWGYIFFISQKTYYSKYLIISILSFHVFLSVYTFLKDGIQFRFYNELVCLDSLAQVVWVLIFFFNLYKNEEVERLETKPMFWFCLGILIYAPSTYFLFAYYNVIKLSLSDKYQYLWRLHDLMNMLMYISFAKGFLTNKFTNKTNIDVTGI